MSNTKDNRIRIMVKEENDPCRSDSTSVIQLILHNRLECMTHKIQPGDVIVCLSGAETWNEYSIQKRNKRSLRQIGYISIEVYDMEVHKLVQGVKYKVDSRSFYGNERALVKAKSDATAKIPESHSQLIFVDELNNIAKGLKDGDIVECLSGTMVEKVEGENYNVTIKVEDMVAHCRIHNTRFVVKGHIESEDHTKILVTVRRASLRDNDNYKCWSL